MAPAPRPSPARRPSTAWQALAEIGPRQLAQYALYQLSLRSGWLRRRTPALPDPWIQGTGPAEPVHAPRPFLPLPLRETLIALLSENPTSLLAEAEEIVHGRVRLFGAGPRPLELVPPGPLDHWTFYARGRTPWGREDVKLIWEPGRFGWACTLARAFHLSGDSRYAQTFWEKLETFLDSNPPNLGPHWASAQEVALRLICLAFAFHAFAEAPETTPRRAARLGWALGVHAARLPPTLAYARAQGNNHLLTEAAGLYTAGLALPGHPRATGWRDLGRRTFEKALVEQIDAGGGYVQHSANYHRLMLQISLWVAALAREAGSPLGEPARQRLAAATRWLLDLTDPHSGGVPNLGPNDGALILPLADAPFQDFRPTLSAAARTFLGESPFPPGPADEPALWLAPREAGYEVGAPPPPAGLEGRPHVLHNPASDSWVYLRAARFTGRPGHADQLHLDLWWRGLNVARDPGTYRYNGPPPWDNALAGTAFHNTLVVDGSDQMTRAGRFLWLRWAQAEVTERREDAAGRLTSLTAQHNGYREQGVVHQRKVIASIDGRWEIDDVLLPAGRHRGPPRHARLHWLLPDWPWSLKVPNDHVHLQLRSPVGELALVVRVAAEGVSAPDLVLIRAGELLAGEAFIHPAQGWFSPTYDLLEPALSLAVTVRARPPIRFQTHWIFGPEEEDRER